MKTSEKLYSLFRQASDLKDALEEIKEESYFVGDAVLTADKLCDEIFDSVGKAAAYEIDTEWIDKAINNEE